MSIWKKLFGGSNESSHPQNAVKFQPYHGTGVCDVCNCSLGSVTAYIVPNSVFYSSRAYRNLLKSKFGMSDAHIEQMRQQDRSPGSAVCENCIYMY